MLPYIAYMDPIGMVKHRDLKSKWRIENMENSVAKNTQAEG